MFTAILYTDNRAPEPLFRFVLHAIDVALEHAAIEGAPRPQLLVLANDTVPHLPVYGTCHTVRGVRGYHDCYLKVAAGLEMAVSDTVFLLEHDVLYPPDYFTNCVARQGQFVYNVNLWTLNQHGAWKTPRCVTSQVVGHRADLIACFAERLQWLKDGRRITWDEPGGMGEVAPMVKRDFRSPAVDVRYGANLTGMREAPRGLYLDTVPTWGKCADLWKHMRGEA